LKSVRGCDQTAITNTYRVLYDDQCEICQAGASWLRLLDGRGLTECVPISGEALAALDPRLELEGCLRELHVLDPTGNIHVGWEAVVRLARLFPATWLVGALGAVWPFRVLAWAAYRFVARNRYAISKCRGGACRSSRPRQVRQTAALSAFWSCHVVGLLMRFPLIVWSAVQTAAQRVQVFLSTRQKRVDLLGGRLSILFLHGFFPSAVPLLFGELFTAVLYDGIAVDPGSPKMRRSLARHLRKCGEGDIRMVVATHAHEEHVGNLEWLARRTGAAVALTPQTAELLRNPARLPWVRRTIIGQPPALAGPCELLGSQVPTSHGRLEVIPTPGHCDDHAAFYDAEEKLLLAGDAFMGTYFATPNPDVDSRKWIATLERLAQLDVEILIEGHGHIHTLRPDVPEIPGVVVREHPRAAIEEKLSYMRWLRGQIETGFGEGLPIRAVEATCFPWARRHAWENFANDEMTRLLSMGHFSRSELVRSFVRNPHDVLPTVYEARFHASDSKS
jgi:glyoxylase-like metal-dependent hydrolase (beta-lactamase superfamily II)/predicted DCC family thiol-disulfide oxidoreductase YuxK